MLSCWRMVLCSVSGSVVVAGRAACRHLPTSQHGVYAEPASACCIGHTLAWDTTMWDPQCCVPPYKPAKSAWPHSLLFLLQRGQRCLSLSAFSLQHPLGTGVLLPQRTLRTAASAWTPSAISSSCGASLAASTPFTTSAYLSGWPQAISAALCADGTQSSVHGQIKGRLQA